MRKGQAALEFLSTYGFALLIILVMIGALWYFGVLKPGNFLPERCLVGNEFQCEDYQIVRNVDDTATVSFFISNNLGNTVILNPVLGGANEGPWPARTAVAGIGEANATWGGGTCEPAAGVAAPVNIVGGQSVEIVCVMDVPPSGAAAVMFPQTGEKIKVSINLLYEQLGGRYPHPIKGEVFATMQ